MSKQSFKDFLKEAMSGSPGDDNDDDSPRRSGPPKSPEALAALANDLRVNYAARATKHEFVPGQLIQWKSGQRWFKTPDYNQPLIVSDEQPERHEMRDPEKFGSPEYGSIIDIRIGLIASNGTYAEFLADSRLFEPYTGPTLD